MDYHLYHDGRNWGEFSLEELGRCGAAGKLTGAECVWREGMADWQSLDAVLQSSASPPPAGPPPLPTPAPKRKRTGVFVAVVAVAVVLVLTGIAVVGFKAAHIGKRVVEAIEQAKAFQREGG